MSTAASDTYPSSRALIRLVLQSALPRPQKIVLLALLTSLNLSEFVVG